MFSGAPTECLGDLRRGKERVRALKKSIHAGSKARTSCGISRGRSLFAEPKDKSPGPSQYQFGTFGSSQSGTFQNLPFAPYSKTRPVVPQVVGPCKYQQFSEFGKPNPESAPVVPSTAAHSFGKDPRFHYEHEAMDNTRISRGPSIAEAPAAPVVRSNFEQTVKSLFDKAFQVNNQSLKAAQLQGKTSMPPSMRLMSTQFGSPFEVRFPSRLPSTEGGSSRSPTSKARGDRLDTKILRRAVSKVRSADKAEEMLQALPTAGGGSSSGPTPGPNSALPAHLRAPPRRDFMVELRRAGLIQGIEAPGPGTYFSQDGTDAQDAAALQSGLAPNQDTKDKTKCTWIRSGSTDSLDSKNSRFGYAPPVPGGQGLGLLNMGTLSKALSQSGAIDEQTRKVLAANPYALPKYADTIAGIKAQHQRDAHRLGELIQGSKAKKPERPGSTSGGSRLAFGDPRVPDNGTGRPQIPQRIESRSKAVRFKPQTNTSS